MSSNAIGSERIAKVVGYNITAAPNLESATNLPQRIAIFGEANTANQGTLSTDPKEVTSATEVGEIYGFGSPLYQMMRILRPVNSGGVGGIPTVIYPQAVAAGASSKINRITISGAASANGTHFVEIAGREGIDGSSFQFTVLKGETEEEISLKIADAINNVLTAVVIASVVDGATTWFVDLETKWEGLSAQDVKVRIVTNDNDLGLTYVISETQAGAGTPDIATALTAFGEEWNTIVLNPYGTTKLDDFEAHNGKPDPNSPTGRYLGRIFKPYVALFGSTLSDKDEIIAITDSRKDELTNALCPAPNSFGMPYEAAANMCAVWVRIAQDSPHLDASDSVYPDMPGIGSNTEIGDMKDYNNRDLLVKKGSSTVVYVNGSYRVEDFVTTYHKDGETPANFRYVSNLNIDWNVRYRYLLKEQIFVIGHAIVGDDDIVSATKIIKPKQWIRQIGKLADELVADGLIVNSQFTKDGIVVEKGAGNPDRLDSSYPYKRRSFARISSTTVEAGFSFN